MRKASGIAGVTFALLAVAASGTSGQRRPAGARADSTPLQELVLDDGGVYRGTTVGATDERVSFRLLSGELIEVSRERVRSLSPALGSVHGDTYWAPDPNRGRLFFGATARTLPRGHGSLEVLEWQVPLLTAAFSDRVTISFGTPFDPGFDAQVQPLVIGPRWRVWGGERLDVALGTWIFTPNGSYADDALIAHAVATYGTGDNALTVGLLRGWGDRDVPARDYALMVGGEVRLARYVKVIAESYVDRDHDVVPTFGLRLFGEHLAAEVGVMLPVYSDDLTETFPVANLRWSW